MTHAECQDLLLDLAYGELDAARAAEVQSHLAGCADCQRDQAQIAETRRMASPLRAVEEPSSRFDARILAAARAEANLRSDGLPGQVIEVKGSVQPLGLQAARIDAHAVAAAPAKRKPRWALRVALGGSVAAAAALALVMSTTLSSRTQEKQAAARYEIRVEAVAQKAQSEALAKAEQAKAEPRAPAPTTDAVAPPQPSAPVVAQAPAEKKAKRAVAKPSRDDEMGSGGDIAGLGARGAGHAGSGEASGVSNDVQGLLGPAPAAKPAPAPAEVAQPPPAQMPPPPAEVAVTVPPPAKVAEAPSPPKAAEPAAAEDAPRRAVAVASARGEMKSLAAASPAAAAAVNAGLLESQAQAARHGGNYALAATLYRRAAALRQSEKDKDAGTAAWDLVHAVECLAAAGQFDEAQRVRAELERTYPAESTPIMAANRALRAYVPAAAPAAAAPAKTAPPQKAADEAEAH
jgi:hypothetical protein